MQKSMSKGNFDEPAASPEPLVEKSAGEPEPAKKPFYRDTTFLVVSGVMLGGGVGYSFSVANMGDHPIQMILALPGSLWLKALRCVVLPMVIFAMIEAMMMMKSLPGAANIGIAVVGWYAFLPSVAATEASIFGTLIINNFVEPDPAFLDGGSGGPGDDEVDSLFVSVIGIFDQLVPGNFVQEAASGNLLPLIISALLFGLIIKAERPDGSPSYVIQFVGDCNKVVVRVISLVMSVTPIGVSSLVFASASRLQIEEFLQVGWLVAAALLTLFCHFSLFYTTLVAVYARRAPCKYFGNAAEAFMTALGTSSSAATLPVSTRIAIDVNGIAPHIAKFVLSLGATIGMDGTAIYLICATLFLARQQAFAFQVAHYAQMCILATLCAAGSAPVPSASLLLLQTIMVSLGIEHVQTHFGLIIAVDWALDRARTVVNVAGDTTVVSLIDMKFGNGAGAVQPEDEEAEAVLKEAISFAVVKAKQRSVDFGGMPLNEVDEDGLLRGITVLSHSTRHRRQPTGISQGHAAHPPPPPMARNASGASVEAEFEAEFEVAPPRQMPSQIKV